MCDKCVELDERIVRLRTIAGQSMDTKTIEAANELIKEMEARKRAFHPEQEQ